MITTERLILIPETPELWNIKDTGGNTLGQLGFLHGLFSIELSDSSKNLGIATEAACAWLKIHNKQKITAVNPINPDSMAFLKHIGFITSHENMKWQGQLPDSQYQQLNKQLGIATDTLKTPYHKSACQLISCGSDVFNRPAKLTPDATQAWHNMQLSATKDNVKLQLLSAYRSPKYQAGLIQKKIDNGQSIKNILCVNTAPGHSEHHTGRAIDLTTPDYDNLEEHFDESPAFQWLKVNAKNHGFSLSYPKDNTEGIIYEPWHWCYQANKQHKT